MGWFIPLLTAGASLLAGKGGSKEGSYSQQSKLSPEQSRLLSQYMQQLQGPVGSAGNLFGYDLVGSQPYQQGFKALQDNLSPFDPQRTQASFDANVSDPAIRNFQERLLPALQQRYIQQGAGRSSAFGANAQASGVDLMSRLSGQRYEALAQAEQNSGARQLQASGQALAYGQAPGNYNLALNQGLNQSLGSAINPGYQENTFQRGQESAAPGILQGLGSYLGYMGNNGSIERANLYGGIGRSFGSAF